MGEQKVSQPFSSVTHRGDMDKHPIAIQFRPQSGKRDRNRIVARSLQQCDKTGLYRWYVQRMSSVYWYPEGEIFALHDTEK